MPRHFYGWLPSPPDFRDHVYAVPQAVSAVALPPSVDNSQPSPGPPFDPPYNQGALGSCGPNTAASDLSFEEIEEAGGPDVMPSRLYIYWCTRYLMGTVYQDSGVNNRTMLKALATYGWCNESLWPYDPARYRLQPSAACFTQGARRRISQYRSVPQDQASVLGCLAAHNCFVLGFTVYDSMETDEVAQTGDVPMPQQGDRVLGGHDVLAVGYDLNSRRIKIKNSWGTDWGDGGYGTLPLDYVLNPRLATDFWVVIHSGMRPTTAVPLPLPPAAEFEVPEAGLYRRAQS